MKTIEIKQNQNSSEILEIVMNNPKKHNALYPEMIKELTSVFDNKNDILKNIKCILLYGNGKSYSAGADLNYMKSMIEFSQEENIEDAKELANLFEVMIKCEIPIISIAHGNVFGGGNGLIAASDISIAVEDTKFCFSEVKLGLAPAVISPYVNSKIGFANARRFYLTAEVFLAMKAKKINLISEVFQNIDEAFSFANKLADKILKNGKQAMSSVKEMTNSFFGLSNFNYIQDEKEKLYKLIANLRVSEEAQKRLSDFF